MLPSLVRLLMRANNHRSDLPDEILDKIDGIIGSDDPCNGLRKLCELRKDLCSEEVYRAACSHFRYNTVEIRRDFLRSRNVPDAKHTWRFCFRQLCARPKLTDADFPGQMYKELFSKDEKLREGVSWADVRATMQQFQGAVDVAANNQWTHPRYGHISYWDVSQVTNMYGAFWRNRTFNENINLWDVSSVTDMSFMFAQTHEFNQPLEWDVSSVTDMRQMFYGADAFNQPLDHWNVSRVENMDAMFEDSAQYPLPDW